MLKFFNKSLRLHQINKVLHTLILTSVRSDIHVAMVTHMTHVNKPASIDKHAKKRTECLVTRFSINKYIKTKL